MRLFEILGVSSLVLTTACQFNPKLAYPKDEIYIDGTQMFIHHSRNAFSKDYEVYIDKKRVDPELLNTSGIRISKGDHGIDIVDKKSSKNLRHFDIKIDDTQEKHFELCNTNSSEDFALEDTSESKNICLKNHLE